MDVDWWHIASVAVLGGALGLEIIGAYCAQKERLLIRTGNVPLHTWRYWWAHLFLREVKRTSRQEQRLGALPSELGPVARGFGRVAVGTLFLVRFADGQPLFPSLV